MPYTVFVAINTNYKGYAKYVLIYKNDITGVLKNWHLQKAFDDSLLSKYIL